MPDAPVSEKARAFAQAWVEQALADGLIPRGHKADKPTMRAFARFEAEVRRETVEQAAKVAYRTCAETRHVSLGDKAATAIRAILDGEAG